MHRETRRTIRAVLQGGDVTVLECRRCGTTVDTDAEPCVNCGNDEIARYEIK